MDWKRVKTILIYALIAINILLWFIIKEDNAISNETAIMDKELVLELLNNKEINVDEKIFDNNEEIYNIEVSLCSYDVENIENVFENYNSDRTYDETVYVMDDKQLTYLSNYDILESTFMSKDIIVEKSYILIEDLGFTLDDLYIEEIGQTGRKTIIFFGQIINNKKIKDSYMIISFNNENLIEFKRLWYDIDEVSDIEQSVLSIEDALYYFVGKEYDISPNRVKPISIENLELVYILDTDIKNNRISDVVMAGEPVIYWEIRTSDGKLYLVDAIDN